MILHDVKFFENLNKRKGFKNIRVSRDNSIWTFSLPHKSSFKYICISEYGKGVFSIRELILKELALECKKHKELNVNFDNEASKTFGIFEKRLERLIKHEERFNFDD